MKRCGRGGRAAEDHHGLGQALQVVTQKSEALAAFARALPVQIKHLGPQHPRLTCGVAFRHAASMKRRCRIQNKFTRSMLMLLSVTAGQGCDESESGDPKLVGIVDDGDSSRPAPIVNITNQQSPSLAHDIDLIFSSTIVESPLKEVLSSAIEGELTVEQRDRVARPYRYLGEPYIYTEEAWSRSLTDGVVERGYRVWREKNPSPLTGLVLSLDGPPELGGDVLGAVADANDKGSDLVLTIQLRGLPEWNVPLAPLATVLSPADVQLEAARRATALAEREALFDNLADGIVADIEALGGKVTARLWQIGWLGVTIPVTAFAELAKDERLARIDSERDKTLQIHADVDVWLGQTRQQDFIDADRFHSAGFDGEQSNSSRHSYGDIVVGMTESAGYESGACAFRESPGCTSASRIIDTYACDFTGGIPCIPGTVVDRNSNENHGTRTTAIVLADYKDGQGNGKQLGDSTWTGTACTMNSQCASLSCESGLCAHSSTWENERTGLAPEARAILYGWMNGSASVAAMFESAVSDKVDITSSSWGIYDTNTCDLRALLGYEQAMEVAFDDGILLVASAGNLNGDDATSCQVGDPADLPKVLTINAYDIRESECVGTPRTRCLLDKDSCPGGDGCSARGGGSVTVAGFGSQTNAVSVIDLVAPNRILGTTGNTAGSDGITSDVSGTGGFAGTSAAAPHVTGAAAAVKSEYLANGQTWVNSPGRLHTLMLSMGDRHFSTNPASSTTWTQQLTTTPDPWYGVGRMHMRLFEGTTLSPWSNNFVSRVWTSPGTFTYKPFGTGLLPSGVNIVKCVAYQPEDMSGKSDVAKTKLTVRLLPNCTGAASTTRVSDNFDLKKIAAIQGVTFMNTCVEVSIEAVSVTSEGATMFVSCHFSGVADDV